MNVILMISHWRKLHSLGVYLKATQILEMLSSVGMRRLFVRTSKKLHIFPVPNLLEMLDLHVQYSTMLLGLIR